jgi:hypothetical protein
MPHESERFQHAIDGSGDESRAIGCDPRDPTRSPSVGTIVANSHFVVEPKPSTSGCAMSLRRHRFAERVEVFSLIGSNRTGMVIGKYARRRK